MNIDSFRVLEVKLGFHLGISFITEKFFLRKMFRQNLLPLRTLELKTAWVNYHQLLLFHYSIAEIWDTIRFADFR